MQKNSSSSVVCMYQINYLFLFWTSHYCVLVGKTIIMSSIGYGQMDFFDLDFFLSLKCYNFSLYLPSVRLWRDFRPTTCHVAIESSYRVRAPHALTQFYLFLFLPKTSQSYFIFLLQICVCPHVCFVWNGC